MDGQPARGTPAVIMYRKIDIHIGPSLIRARLVAFSVCKCGHRHINEGVRYGKQYDADIKSVRWVRFQCFGCGKVLEIRVIDIWDATLTPMWFPLCLLDIDAKIPIAAKPMNWQPVKDNAVAPAQRRPLVVQ